MRFKPLNVLTALGLTLSMTLSGLLPALAALAAPAPDHEGYLVGLREGVQMLSGAEESALVVVDSLAEAQSIPAELVEFIEPNYLVELLEDERRQPRGDDTSQEYPPSSFDRPPDFVNRGNDLRERVCDNP